MEGDPSIVEYFAEHEGYRCGYCKSKDTNFSHGMWAHQMHVQDYQDLIDRGWRRSGKYCYKPTMNRTCCPMYTIKCDTNEFKMSKSQKKAIKRVNRFLITGKHDTHNAADDTVGADGVEDGMSGQGDVKNMEAEMAEKRKPSSVIQLPAKTEISPVNQVPPQEVKSTPTPPDTDKPAASSSEVQQTSNKKPPKPGSGPDPNRPTCRKAKELRAEKRQQKLAANPDKGHKQPPTQKNSPKTLEELLSEPDNHPQPAHKLELRLVRSGPRSPEFESSFSSTHQVYHKYQTSIHKDPPSKPNQSQFTRFLCDSPLGELHKEEGGPPMGYGSFHQQYLLDGRIIAVGVIDILPTCVSSVYLYYDPAYRFLSLGIYSALREVAFVRELSRHSPPLHHYYMGFYIHSCPKMRYKGQYYPSFLSCPETYSWVPIETCRPKLEESKYSRMADEGQGDPDRVDDIGQVLVLHRGTAMPYAIYTAMKRKGKNSGGGGGGGGGDQDEVKEYANFVGRTCAQRMLLVRK